MTATSGADPTDPTGGPPDSALLTAEAIDVRFPGVHAAAGVDLRVQRGRVLALLGESGSGKSVTAMSLVGLAPEAAQVGGSAHLADGTELVGAPRPVLDAVRGARVAVIFQEPMRALNPLLTVAAHLRLALRAHATPSRAAMRARSLELLASVGLPDRVLDSYPHELSGGQVQRVCIAMALAGEPEVLLADEPTTALDVTVQAEILDLLRRLAREGLGVVLITHDMGVVADIADEVVVMRAGRVVERGPVQQVFDSPTHPYTTLLLEAVPRLGDGRDRAATTPGDADTNVDDDASLDGEDTDTSADSHDDGPTIRRVVDLRDLHVHFHKRRHGEVRAVDGVDLHIDAGEVVGLVGESGSGKSTLASVLTSLRRPTSGQVRILGRDPQTLSRSEARATAARIGIVFQDPAGSLNPRATVGRSVAEPLVLHGKLGSARRRERVAELLSLVELDPAMGERFPHELSGGQRQRVAIARAIALDPALVVADEPTSALDVSVQAQVLRMFLQLQQRLGFACLFISHDLAIVEQVSRRVYVLRDGQVVEHGPTAQVLAQPREEYTRRLIDAVPVPDPALQARRRLAAGR